MINVSLVLYHTPVGELNNVLRTLLAVPEVAQIFVLDNSEKPLQHLPVEHQRISYIFNGKNLGYGRAHNIAIRTSLQDRTPYHLILNTDVAFHAEDLQKLLHYMDQHPDIGIVMPKVQFPSGAPQRLCKLLPTPMDLLGRRFLPERWIDKRNRRYELADTGYATEMNVPILSGCFMLCRTSALAEVGLFDERFFLYCEDYDLCRRMHTRYQTVMTPQVVISHDFRRGSYHNLRIMWIHIRSTCQYFNKWGWWHDPEREQINRETLIRLNLYNQ